MGRERKLPPARSLRVVGDTSEEVDDFFERLI
jgi:hypothetical protein